MNVSRLNIINASIPGYTGLQQISIRQHRILEIIPMDRFESSLLPVFDVEGDYISLGGVDLQINGALGLAFPDVQPTDIPLLNEICQFLWNQGVDSFLPTIVTTSIDKIQQSLAVFTEFILSQRQNLNSAKILGVHLEGPFLNPEKRGAHQVEYLLPLTLENVNLILENYAETVKIITLAPELDETNEVIPYLNSLGITISLGHSLATESQAEKAFELGANMVTHAFNAMPSLHHREPGLLASAINHPDVFCGLIADGQHVNPSMIKLLLKASDYHQGIFLVSDALSPLGLSDGVYDWDTRKIEVKNGTARLADGTLSGTTLSLFAGVQNLIKWDICDVETAISLGTISPRKALGMLPMLGNSVWQLLRWNFNESEKELTWKRLFSSEL
ncbi:MAG TPA: N-acetylglucosamine-6-phosphate deacetylase [Allocoleopsis sp.]